LSRTRCNSLRGRVYPSSSSGLLGGSGARCWVLGDFARHFSHNNYAIVIAAAAVAVDCVEVIGYTRVQRRGERDTRKGMVENNNADVDGG
jgi:hypothetical protein